MQMNALTSVTNVLAAAEPQVITGTNAGNPGAPFAGLLTDAISSEGALEQQASTAVEGLMQGTGVDVHTAMIATQKANLAFELALSVRNKVVASYQQVMAMQF
jgi:flagellar hook-basal body complex protein FliE